MVKQFIFHRGDSSSELCSTIRQFIGEYPNGVTVTVEPYYQQRTGKQNAMYQLLVHRLSTQSGLPEEYIREEAKKIAIGWGYPVKRDEQGYPIEKDGSFVGISSRDANIAQFKMLIEGLYQLALRNDIILEDVKG